jgi:hypothetical protein
MGPTHHGKQHNNQWRKSRNELLKLEIHGLEGWTRSQKTRLTYLAAHRRIWRITSWNVAILKSCDLKMLCDWLHRKTWTVLRHEAQSTRTQLRPVAVPNNAAPDRGLTSKWLDFRNSAVTRTLRSFVAAPFQIVLRQIRVSIAQSVCSPLFRLSTFYLVKW